MKQNFLLHVSPWEIKQMWDLSVSLCSITVKHKEKVEVTQGQKQHIIKLASKTYHLTITFGQMFSSLYVFPSGN